MPLLPLLQLNMADIAADSSSVPSGERIPDDASIDQTIDAGSVASAESFGGVTQFDRTLDTLSIGSEEGLGDSLEPDTIPIVGAGDINQGEGDSISSEESIGQPSVIGDENTTTYCVEAGQLSSSHPVEAAQVCY